MSVGEKIGKEKNISNVRKFIREEYHHLNEITERERDM